MELNNLPDKNCKVIIVKMFNVLKRMDAHSENSHFFGQFVHDKGGKNRQEGKDHLFNKECWEN